MFYKYISWNYSYNLIGLSIGSLNWGMKIAGISDSEIHNLNLNLKESNSAGRLTKLPSTAKNGAKFRYAICWGSILVILLLN